MLREWDKTNPGRVESIFTALTNVKPSQLADRDLFDFNNLQVNRQANGDTEQPDTEQPESSQINEQILNWMPTVVRSSDSLV